MNLFKKNLIANYSGTIWIALIQFITIPIYLKILGDESWGFLAVLLTLYAFIAIVGSGLSQILPREIAIRRQDSSKESLLGDMAYGTEVVFWVVGIFFGIIVFFFADVLANHWLKLESISVDDAVFSLKILSLQLIIQWPIACYHGFLLGSHEHGKLNKIQVTFVTLKHLICVLMLIFYDASVLVYQISFISISAIETIYTRAVSWKLLNVNRTACKWNASEMKKLAKFALGMTLTVILGGFVVQIDKIILSGLVPVTIFGYYSVVSTLSIALLQLVYPLIKTSYPTYSELVEKKQSLDGINKKLINILSSIFLPAIITTVIFSEDILLIWTQNIALTNEVSVVLSVLAIGTLFNGYYNIPYINYLAFGLSKKPFVNNLVALIVIASLLPISYSSFGIVGAAMAWVVANMILVLIGWTWMLKNHYFYPNVFTPILIKSSILILFTIFIKNMNIGMAGLIIVLFADLIFFLTFMYPLNKFNLKS